MSYRFVLRVKTRMSSEALEDRLSSICRADYTFSLDGIEERDGESLKVMLLTFVSEEDRDAFKRIMRSGQPAA